MGVTSEGRWLGTAHKVHSIFHIPGLLYAGQTLESHLVVYHHRTKTLRRARFRLEGKPVYNSSGILLHLGTISQRGIIHFRKATLAVDVLGLGRQWTSSHSASISLTTASCSTVSKCASSSDLEVVEFISNSYFKQ